MKASATAVIDCVCVCGGVKESQMAECFVRAHVSVFLDALYCTSGLSHVPRVTWGEDYGRGACRCFLFFFLASTCTPSASKS